MAGANIRCMIGQCSTGLLYAVRGRNNEEERANSSLLAGRRRFSYIFRTYSQSTWGTFFAMAAAPDSVLGGQPTLKVMRLYKPRSYDINSACVGPSLGDAFACSQELLLPDSFGNIYLGQSFCSYISVMNHLTQDMYNVGLTAKLQTPTARPTLLDRRAQRTGGAAQPPQNPAPRFEPGSRLDMMVSHALTEIGTHTLRVTVTYSEARGAEPKSLRKYYRFNVLTPLNIALQYWSVPQQPVIPKGKDLNDDGFGGEAVAATAPNLESVFVEARITNTAQNNILLDNVRFMALHGFKVTDLTPPEAGLRLAAGAGRVITGAGGVSGPEEVVEEEVSDDSLLKLELGPVLRPDEVLHFLYRLDPPAGATFEASAASCGLAYGHVEALWKASMGESGALKSGPLVVKPPASTQVEVKAVCEFDVDTGGEGGETGSSRVALHRLSPVCFTITNRSPRSLFLQLQVGKNGEEAGLCFCGVTEKNLGKVNANSSISVTLEMLPVRLGTCSLEGVVVVDLQSSVVHTQPPLLSVLVQQDQVD